MAPITFFYNISGHSNTYIYIFFFYEHRVNIAVHFSICNRCYVNRDICTYKYSVNIVCPILTLFDIKSAHSHWSYTHFRAANPIFLNFYYRNIALLWLDIRHNNFYTTRTTKLISKFY